MFGPFLLLLSNGYEERQKEVITIIIISMLNVWIPITSNEMESFLINNCISCVCQFQQALSVSV